MLGDKNDRKKIFPKELELSGPHRRKNSNQKLLSQDYERLPREEQQSELPAWRPNSVSHEGRQHNAISHDLDHRDREEKDKEYCYPKFLTDLGACCIPCKIYCPCCLCCSCCPCRSDPVFIQQTQSLGLLQEWGRFIQVLPPGLHMVNPISQSIIEVNQQTQVFEYSQVCISKDNVQFDARVAIFYRVVDSLKIAFRLENMDAEECLEELSCGNLRSIAGGRNIQQIIENRNLACKILKQHLNQALDYWGIYVEMTAIQDIKIDPDVDQVLQQVAVTRRKTQALLINARAQVAIAELCRQRLMRSNSKAAYQMRYFQTIDIIMQLNNKKNTIIVKNSLPEDGFLP